MDGPKFGRAGARRPAARIGGWRPKNWKSGDQSRCRERPEFGNDPELEQCGPKIGKARQPAASGGSRRLEKSVFKYHKYCVEDGLSVDTPECRSGVSFLPAPADPPPTRRLPGPPASAGCPAGRSFPPASREFLPAADPPSHWLPRRSPPPLPVAAPAAPSRRPLGSSSPPTPTRRPTGCPVGRFFPSASRELLPADADPPPPGATGFDWLPRRSPPPLPVAAPVSSSRRPFPLTRRFLHLPARRGGQGAFASLLAGMEAESAGPGWNIARNFLHLSPQSTNTMKNHLLALFACAVCCSARPAGCFAHELRPGNPLPSRLHTDAPIRPLAGAPLAAESVAVAAAPAALPAPEVPDAPEVTGAPESPAVPDPAAAPKTAPAAAPEPGSAQGPAALEPDSASDPA